MAFGLGFRFEGLNALEGVIQWIIYIYIYRGVL